MNRFKALSVTAALLLASASSWGDEGVIASTQAGQYVGTDITVCGHVAQVVVKDRYSYINFDKKYPNQEFTLFITKQQEYGDLKQYENRHVCAGGKIGSYKGKPEITDPTKIVFAD